MSHADRDTDHLLASQSGAELSETGCTLWVTRWTRFLLYSTPIVSAVYCIYFIGAQEANVAVRCSRYLSGVAAVFMIVSLFIMYYNIKFWRNSLLSESERNAQHVSKTVIVIVCALAFVTFAGYVKMIPTIVVLFNFDVALDYTYRYEVVLDLFYNITFIIFLPVIIIYTIIYAPKFRTYERTTNILICTLLLCFLQKWMYETITINEHICQELLEDNRPCFNRNATHFVSSLQNLTVRQRRLYDSLIDESPYIYTCTMEFLPAIGALLVLLRRRAHRKAENKVYDDIAISKQRKTFAYGLIALLIAAFSSSLFAQPMLCLLYDNKELLPWAMFGHGIIRLTAHSISFTLFSTLRKSYNQLASPSTGAPTLGPSAQPSTPAEIARHSRSVWVIFDLPDLSILAISGSFTLALQAVKFIIHIGAYVVFNTSMNFPSMAQVFVHDTATFVQMASFYMQYRVIKKFLTFDKSSINKLRTQKFVVHLAPAALTINALRFGAIYLSQGNFLAPYDTKSYFFDNLLSILDSAYPGSLMFSMTAALCWAHIIERLYKAGAYRVVPD